MNLNILLLSYVAGILSFLSPCAFPLLPCYVSYYMGGQDEKTSLPVALIQGAVVSLGGMAVVACIALGAVALGALLSPVVTTAWIFVAAVLIALGCAMLISERFQLHLPLRRPRVFGLMGLFAFGALYILASSACTAPVVIGLVLLASTSGAFMGVLVMFLYLAGMVTLMIPLTVCLSCSKTLLYTKLKRLMPHVRLLSAAILILMGIVVIISNLWV
ncbi:MAG: cytochrome c biogenesis protein CcdA [Candidatus Thermoplasmatota archaeon]